MAASQIKILRQKKADLAAELTAARTATLALLDAADTGKRNLTDEEEKQFTAYDADMKRIQKAIERNDAMLATEDELQQQERDIAARMPAQPQRDSYVEGQSAQVGETREALRPFASLGEQLTAVFRASQPAHGVDPRLLRLNAAATGSNETVPSDGGYLVQHDFSTEIVKKMYMTGEILSRVRKVPIGPNSNGLRMNGIDETSRANGSRWGGIQVYWLAEAAQKTPTRPKFRQMEWNLKKVAGLWYVTDEMLQDSTVLESVAMEAFPEEITFVVEDAIVNGDGVGKPLGFLAGPATVSVAKETGQSAGTVVYENIVKMWARAWGRSRANMVWLINQDLEPHLYTMGITLGTGGAPVYLPPGGVSAAPFSTLFGRPVIPVEYMATAGTVGDIALVDLSQYLLIDKGGIQTATSIHVRFDYDETAFRFVYRVDGKPLWSSVLTPYKGSATLAPVVTLATRA